jgi:hypothetical protein
MHDHDRGMEVVEVVGPFDSDEEAQEYIEDEKHPHVYFESRLLSEP